MRVVSRFDALLTNFFWSSTLTIMVPIHRFRVGLGPIPDSSRVGCKWPPIKSFFFVKPVWIEATFSPWRIIRNLTNLIHKESPSSFKKTFTESWGRTENDPLAQETPYMNLNLRIQNRSASVHLIMRLDPRIWNRYASFFTDFLRPQWLALFIPFAVVAAASSVWYFARSM